MHALRGERWDCVFYRIRFNLGLVTDIVNGLLLYQLWPHLLPDKTIAGFSLQLDLKTGKMIDSTNST